VKSDIISKRDGTYIKRERKKEIREEPKLVKKLKT
jgi:hypothetical protein